MQKYRCNPPQVGYQEVRTHYILLEDDGRAVFEKWQRATKFRATPLEIYTSTKVPESPVDFSCPLCSSINKFLHLGIFLVVPFLRVAGGRLKSSLDRSNASNIAQANLLDCTIDIQDIHIVSRMLYFSCAELFHVPSRLHALESSMI